LAATSVSPRALCVTSASRNIVEAVSVCGAEVTTRKSIRPRRLLGARHGKTHRVKDSAWLLAMLRTSKGFPLVVISVSWRARLVRPYEAKQLGKTCTAGKTDFQLATQSTRRKRQQMRAHPKDKSAS
jgi:hypothetical protein